MINPRVDAFAVLGDALLIDSRDGGGTVRLDPITGSTTPWSVTWSPTAAGWRLVIPDVVCGHPQARADGRWVALACMFEPRPAPRSGKLTSAILVARPDGSEPRCVGVGLTTDEYPPFTWLREPGRLLGDWTVDCAPGPDGRLRELRGAPRSGPATRWFDPDSGAAGVHPFSPDFADKDPLGDLALVRYHNDRDKSHGLGLFDLRTGSRLQDLPEADELQWAAGWVAPDAILVNTHRDNKLASQRLVYADGRVFTPPDVTWRHYIRLPNGEHLFTRDRGVTVEQGRVDWPRFHVESSRPRPDLHIHLPPFERTTYTTFTPALGGLLIHDPRAGTLVLADL